LSDYYSTKISPNIETIANVNNDPTKLLHGLPTNPNETKQANNRYAKIDHKAVVDKCLRPIANYLYIHCGFELIIIDEYNNNAPPNDDDDDALKALEIYRNKLIDNMITLLCEGILIGISEIADQLEIKDIDTIIQDIKSLDENMIGIELVSAQFLVQVLRLFHSTSVLFQLNIEDSSSEEDNSDPEQNTVENQFD